MSKTEGSPVTDAGVFGLEIFDESCFVGSTHLGGGALDGPHLHVAALAEFPAGLLREHLPRLALGQEPKVNGLGDVLTMGVAQALQDFLVSLGVGNILEILRVGLAIVQFLNGPFGAGEMPLSRGHFFGISEAIKLVANLAAIRPDGGLVVAEVRHVVADVKVSVVAHGAGEVAHFVHAIAVPVNVAARRGSVLAEERFTLHCLGDRQVEQVQHRGRVVHKTHEPIGGGSGFTGGEVLPFFGEANDQWHVHAAIEQGAFVARHAATMVAVKKHNGVFRETVLLQLLEDCAHLQVHCRDTIIKARQLAPHQRGIRIIRRQRHLVRVMDIARRQSALHLLLEPRVRPHHRPALVRGHQVKHTEKRLRFIAALAPVGGGAAFVPRRLDDLCIIARVVIGFHVVSRVISTLA